MFRTCCKSGRRCVFIPHRSINKFPRHDTTEHLLESSGPLTIRGSSSLLSAVIHIVQVLSLSNTAMNMSIRNPVGRGSWRRQNLRYACMSVRLDHRRILTQMFACTYLQQLTSVRFTVCYSHCALCGLAEPDQESVLALQVGKLLFCLLSWLEASDESGVLTQHTGAKFSSPPENEHSGQTVHSSLQIPPHIQVPPFLGTPVNNAHFFLKGSLNFRAIS